MLHRRQLLAAGLTGAAAMAAVRPAEAMPVVARPQAQALVGRPVAAVELTGKTNAAAFALRSAVGVLTDAPGRLAMRARADGLRATGSGFFIDAEGHLLTCAHVLEGASTIAVRLPEGGQAPARLVGADTVSDIAVLHVENRGNAPHLFLSAEDRAETGDVVLAIGDPLGYAASVTRGIVSATGRRYRAEDALRYVQHDAAVNRGSSGGALVDETGRLVGMNAAIADGSFGFAGIAFAIPV
ncbi:MAG TPA: trypsin-like peptidase domain-containing protein, partial [Rhizobiaceae bacterium]|nr:trypsin-like peptidase domain-containing protein [Rhizobiaceae bacterium]